MQAGHPACREGVCEPDAIHVRVQSALRGHLWVHAIPTWGCEISGGCLHMEGGGSATQIHPGGISLCFRGGAGAEV